MWGLMMVTILSMRDREGHLTRIFGLSSGVSISFLTWSFNIFWELDGSGNSGALIIELSIVGFGESDHPFTLCNACVFSLSKIVL